MHIRKLKPEDCDLLAKLFFDTIRNVNIKDYTAEQVAVWAPADRDLAAWRKSFSGKTVFVAEDDGTPVAFAELEPNGHIDRFYVAQDWIGKGVGKMLYDELEKKAIEQKLTRLFVEASITAMPFFKRLGFSITKRQTVLRSSVGLDNFVMEKDLTVL